MPDLTRRVARELTDATRSHGLAFVDGILALWNGNAHVALGYTSRRGWQEYIDAEFTDLPRVSVNDRPALVERLSEAGMSTRQIAPVVGTSAMQVSRDRASSTVTNVTELSLSTRIERANDHIEAYLPEFRAFNSEFCRRHLRTSLLTTGRQRAECLRAFQALHSNLTQVIESLTITRTESDPNA